jgi:hypothetical protein
LYDHLVPLLECFCFSMSRASPSLALSMRGSISRAAL